MFSDMKVNNSFTLENSFFQINSRNEDSDTTAPSSSEPTTSASPEKKSES